MMKPSFKQRVKDLYWRVIEQFLYVTWPKLKSLLKKLWKQILKILEAISPLKIFIGFVILVLVVILINILSHGCQFSSSSIAAMCNRLIDTTDSGTNIPSIGTAIERLGFAIGGLIALFVALASFQRAKALDKTAEEEVKGNFEERYKNAIDQLRHETASIRLGGVYGLYHLARDNRKYSSTICDLLCGYVRELTTSIIVEAQIPEGKVNKKYKDRHLDEPSNEVQSILNILTKKIDEQGIPFASKRIDLSGAYLKGANLWEANLKGAQLRGVHLESADLSEAHFEGANLIQVHLEGADLRGAHLEGAYLIQARLQGANLIQTHFEGAHLVKVHLEGAYLIQAHLEGAYLREAHLKGAVLWNARLEGAVLWNARLEGAVLWNARLEGAVLREAHLEGAELSHAYLGGAELSHAYLGGADLTGTDFRGSIAEEKKKEIPSMGSIELLKDRAGKMDKLKTAVFNGGIKKEYLKDFKKQRKELEKKLGKIFNNEANITRFKSKMNSVQKALEANINKKASYKIPREYAKSITRGVFPKKEADEIIKRLKKIKKRVTKIRKRYKR